MAVSDTSPRQSLPALLEAADAHARRCADELEALIPPGTMVVDVHTHLGVDEDGMVAEPGELLGTLAQYGIARAFTFCLNEPDRRPAFRAANDRTLAHARRAAGRLVPFARLDVDDGAVPELERCLRAGAAGIKLHPRAQRFPLNDSRIEAIFGLAAEHGVPILIHGGNGLPPIAAELERLLDVHGTAIIVAHAGVADMDGLTRRFAGRPGVYFDTSVWSPLDLLGLLARVAPEQVLYGSDYPYGQQPASLYSALRAACRAGLGATELGRLLGATAIGIADRQATPELGRVRMEDHVCLSVAMARVHQGIAMAAPMLWSRRRDTAGGLGQAIGACDPEEHGRIRDMLTIARRLWRSLADVRASDARTVARATLQLLQLADTLAVCT